ncbi:hypothetical protein LXL04_011117 [Taraxacum kok-saghyz]
MESKALSKSTLKRNVFVLEAFAQAHTSLTIIGPFNKFSNFRRYSVDSLKNIYMKMIARPANEGKSIIQLVHILVTVEEPHLMPNSEPSTIGSRVSATTITDNVCTMVFDWVKFRGNYGFYHSATRIPPYMIAVFTFMQITIFDLIQTCLENSYGRVEGAKDGTDLDQKETLKQQQHHSKSSAH